MTKKKACGAKFDGKKEVLTCTLEDGHAGPVHQDADGAQWRDATLPAPEPIDLED